MKLTDERLNRILNVRIGDIEPTPLEVAMAREILLLRAECRAAREIRKLILPTDLYPFNYAGQDAVKAYEAARKNTDEGGFSL